MGFRTIVIKNRAKLDFSLNYLVCRSEKEKRIHLDEISMIIIESTAVSFTTALLSELVKKKIKVVFCDEKHLPSSQLIGFDDNYHSVKRIMEQVAWDDEIKGLVWQNIIENKINNQRKLLCAMGIVINLDRNDKKLANGLVKFFTRAIAEKSSEFAEYFARGYSLLNSISGELYPNVDFDEDIDYAGFIKLFKPTFSYKDKDFLEKLLLYIDALVEFCDTKIIVTVNVKSYLNNEEFLELYKHARYMQVPIFCIESHETYKIKEEKIVIIDSDLCEIVK